MGRRDRLLGKRVLPDLRAPEWRVGDLSICVRDDWTSPCKHSPNIGDVLRVVGVTDCVAHGVRAIWLVFADRPHAYFAGAFRKPVADDRPAEEEFAVLIRRGARLPEPVAASEVIG